jgi:hypothetical protein
MQWRRLAGRRADAVNRVDARAGPAGRDLRRHGAIGLETSRGDCGYWHERCFDYADRHVSDSCCPAAPARAASLPALSTRQVRLRPFDKSRVSLRLTGSNAVRSRIYIEGDGLAIHRPIDGTFDCTGLPGTAATQFHRESDRQLKMGQPEKMTSRRPSGRDRWPRFAAIALVIGIAATFTW